MTYVIDPDGVETSVLSRLGGLDGVRVLEIGCGDGRLTFRYAAATGSVLALDPDGKAIDAARAALHAPLADRIRFELGSAEELDAPPESFDAVFLSHSL